MLPVTDKLAAVNAPVVPKLPVVSKLPTVAVPVTLKLPAPVMLPPVLILPVMFARPANATLLPAMLPVAFKFAATFKFVPVNTRLALPPKLP